MYRNDETKRQVTSRFHKSKKWMEQLNNINVNEDKSQFLKTIFELRLDNNWSRFPIELIPNGALECYVIPPTLTARFSRPWANKFGFSLGLQWTVIFILTY